MKKISAAMKELGMAAGRAKAKMPGWLRNALTSRESLGRIGYYAALLVLLAALGSASYAYRNRRARESGAAAGTPLVAGTQNVQAISPVEKATPTPAPWVWPLKGEIIGAYSPDEPVWSETLSQWQTHPALDLSGAPGEAVFACRDGIVSDAWSDRLWGNVIVIEHEDGYRSTYAGLNTIELVEPGERVTAGSIIGSVGQSAACEADKSWHLHFELTREGEPVDFQSLAE